MPFYKMGFCQFGFVISILILGVVDAASDDVPFDVNYEVTWGNHHASFFDQGKEAQFFLDRDSGAGFGSKLSYGTGFFHLKIRLPNKDSSGVVTAFYLTSSSNNHDELDFEFLGNKEGKPITVQTNVFANGKGDREQRILLWFDPTADFHTYMILWNSHQIVFYVDDIPIRVYKKMIKAGVDYPKQGMKVQASIWNGDSWATDGGQTKINWTCSPFTAHFRGFAFSGCLSSDQDCYDPHKYWWNQSKYWKLNYVQQNSYERVRQNYMNYDYCHDTNRHPTPPIECAFNT